MIDKVVFLLFGLPPRADKRIREFVENGFEVEVYGVRSDSSKKFESSDIYTYHDLNIIGESSSHLERIKNIPLYRQVVKKYDKNKTLFYFFTLNTSVISLLTPGIKYIYEESDMLFDRSNNELIRKLVIKLNKRVITKSYLTVFTSEGFADFYYGQKVPSNVVVVPNRVSFNIQDYTFKKNSSTDFSHLKIGFVGMVRYKTVINVSEVIAEKFPNHEFHFYGDMSAVAQDIVGKLKRFPNVFMHGSYKYPSGLIDAYQNLDLVISTYDSKGINPQYAEPNKLYESIYFETPIIASSNTFLAKKIERLGIGFSIDSNDKNDIYEKIKNITPEQYGTYIKNISLKPKQMALNINTNFFKLLKECLNSNVKKVFVPQLQID